MSFNLSIKKKKEERRNWAAAAVAACPLKNRSGEVAESKRVRLFVSERERKKKKKKKKKKEKKGELDLASLGNQST